jgi:hypothetical protein
MNNLQMLSREQNVQVCDATDDDSSTTAWYIILFLPPRFSKFGR